MLRRSTSALQHGLQAGAAAYGPQGGMSAKQPRIQLDPRAFVRRPPRNTVLNITPQGETWVVERFGKYLRTQQPGLHVVAPLIDRIRYVYSSKEQGIIIPHQSAITRDNVMVDIDGILFLRIMDAEKASYNIDNPIFNLISMAQTTMRSEIGKLTLDTLFEERAQLNVNIIKVIQEEALAWGVECKRYEIRDINVSDIVRVSMDLQAEAERKKRKLILESEGESKAVENRAVGQKLAQNHLADADLYTQKLAAEGQAFAIERTAMATKGSIDTLSKAIEGNKENADRAIGLRVAEQYLEQFGNIAKEGNTIVLNSNMSDPSGFVTQALGMYKAMNNTIGSNNAGDKATSIPVIGRGSPQSNPPAV